LPIRVGFENGQTHTGPWGRVGKTLAGEEIFRWGIENWGRGLAARAGCGLGGELGTTAWGAFSLSRGCSEVRTREETKEGAQRWVRPGRKKKGAVGKLFTMRERQSTRKKRNGAMKRWMEEKKA